MSVKKVDTEWVAECKHGGNETWTIHRATEYLAQRSLKAHRRGCLAYALLTEMPDDDDWHAFTVLTRWAWMLSNTYGGKTPEVWTVTNAADYLDRVLNRVAQDPDQDFAQMARELRKCRSRLESVLRDSLEPERGAPCPTCKDDGKFVRLIREYAHWCEDPDCEQFHFITDDADVWVCPRNKDHWWTIDGFADEQRERTSA